MERCGIDEWEEDKEGLVEEGEESEVADGN